MRAICVRATYSPTPHLDSCSACMHPTTPMSSLVHVSVTRNGVTSAFFAPPNRA